MEDRIKYWIELSDYDFETAEAMLKSKRYLYVGFMCHQTIEKALKAYYIKTKQTTAPYTHSLSHLAKKCELTSVLSEAQQDFLDQIETLNIESSYPSHKERLLKSLTATKCFELISKTKEFQEWIKTKLLQN